MEFFLGRSMEESVTFDKIEHFDIHIDKNDPAESYISFPFKNGTACDLTNQPRTTEVRMFCASDEKRQLHTANQVRQAHFVGDMEEPTTCGYVLKFYTSVLCNLPGFSKQEQVINKVQCVSTAALSLP
jgi:protein OS-9